MVSHPANMRSHRPHGVSSLAILSPRGIFPASSSVVARGNTPHTNTQPQQLHTPRPLSTPACQALLGLYKGGGGFSS